MVAAIRASSVNVKGDTVRLLVPDSIIAPESPQALPAVHGDFMSEILNCDPSKGFVAFPVALFDLDLSPGAFRTLAELCRMANSSGQCWPSLAQLGKRLGRSRASISAYISELRCSGVLTTEEQKMANGYNYRLRYTVTFWKEWRAGLGKTQKEVTPVPTKNTERRVQPTVRPLKTKNHIHKKQQTKCELSELVSDWREVVGTAPYPALTSTPSPELLETTTLAVEVVCTSKAVISADIEKALIQFACAKGLHAEFTEEAQALLPHITTIEALDGLIDALSEEWKPHWKKPPNSFQLIRLLEARPSITSAETQQKLLKSYLRRWKLFSQRLPSTALASKVAA